MKNLILLITLCLFSSISWAECVEGDCFTGHGREITAAGSYQGNFLHFRRHGEGAYTAVDGDKYVGEWARDLPHGHGTYYWKNGDQYVGQFWYQRRHGFGVLTRASGEVSEGIWLDGRLMSHEELSKNLWIPLVPMRDQQIKLFPLPRNSSNGNSHLQLGPSLYGLGVDKISHRNHPDRPNQVQIKKSAGYLWPLRHAEASCRGLKGTGLAEILTKPTVLKGRVHYPNPVTVTCMTQPEWAEEQVRLVKVEEDKNKKRAEKRAADQARIEWTRRESAARLQAKKDECTSFGFEPKTPDHAECVMKLAIAEKARNKSESQSDALAQKARNKSESQANAIAEQSAAAAAAYQAEIRRVQAQQEAANREAREAAKRQREAQLLINLGGAISSGQFPLGNASGPSFSDEPMPSFDSGRYKECFYRVAGDRLSISIPRAEGCPATRTFGSVTGYLTR